MARKNRKWFPGAIYHIMARGNYGQNISFFLFSSATSLAMKIPKL